MKAKNEFISNHHGLPDATAGVGLVRRVPGLLPKQDGGPYYYGRGERRKACRQEFRRSHTKL